MTEHRMDDWGRIFGGNATHAAEPHPLRRPETWPGVAGFALTLLGLFVPWATFSGTGGSAGIGPVALGAEGGLATIGAAAVFGLLASRGAADSGYRTVQVLPATLAFLALGLMIIGVQNTLLDVANPALVYVPVGINGSYAYASEARIGPGVWISLAGAVLVTAGGITASIARVRRNGVHTDEPVGSGELLSAYAPFLELLAVGAVAVVAGAAAGIAVAGAAFPTDPLLTLWGGIVGAILGPAAVVFVWRFVRRLR